MRMRYRQVTYRSVGAGAQHQLEQHYRRLLNEALRQGQQSISHRSSSWRPLADILESPEMMIVKVELAGMTEEEIEVTLYEDALIVSGTRQDIHGGLPNLYYHEAQVRYGPFRLEVYIPYPIQGDAVTARYENGFLWVELPRLPQAGAERVAIQRPDTDA
ncbi:hypothetical protein KSC_076800 [Ktedonobacter sp. SOSP1-52]|uniref:Hsp20/alpha crystallin family protein n=1 Tax=Ktedonobacter sp. SOSP1-52 TaxID=2778366 RepID=UPI00191685A8|nr:Hsp20/alpha crystallin family protein [Ktedonobacter sp. SOSP1-52]GHO68788.1 hypothetical protein KSC_076800 [Ktedonobacter sp. SOSP1-52]